MPLKIFDRLYRNGFFDTGKLIWRQFFLSEGNRTCASPENTCQFRGGNAIGVRHAVAFAVVKIDIIRLVDILRNMNHGNAIGCAHFELQGIVAAEDVVSSDFLKRPKATQGDMNFGGNIWIETDIADR